MKKKNVVTMLFPAMIMTVITTTSFVNMIKINSIDFKGLFVISLVLLFPILFLLQGIVCALINNNKLLSLGISIITFIVLMIIYLNSSASIYILIYIIAWIIGYLLTKFIIKNKAKPNN